MDADRDDLKKEVWGWLKPAQTVHLATWDGNRPRVRPVSLIFEEGRFWVSTGSGDAKVSQIESNPVFEFSLMLEGEGGTGTLRCSGTAGIVTDPGTKGSMAGRIPFFGQYWETPDDPTFCLVELRVMDVEYMRPGEMVADRFSV
jgi:general stress protein 26